MSRGARDHLIGIQTTCVLCSERQPGSSDGHLIREAQTTENIVFRDRRREEVTWTRKDIVDPFTLRNASGELVLLSPGQTWIHVLPRTLTIPSR